MSLQLTGSITRARAFRLTAALALVLTVPHAARAAEFQVNVLLDLPDVYPGDGVCSVGLTGGQVHSCTLRAAIMEANALRGAERHVIYLGPGVHLVNRRTVTIHPGLIEDDEQTLRLEGAVRHDAYNDLDIGVDLEIIGAGQATTIVEGNFLDRVFHVLNHNFMTPVGPAYVRFANLTIRNGGSLQRGAGIFFQVVGEAVLEDVTVENNRGGVNRETEDGRLFTSVGGGIHSRAGHLVVTRGTIRGNTAGVGGGLAVAFGVTTIADTAFENNEAIHSRPSVVGSLPGMGGGIAVLDSLQSPASFRMSGSTLSGNRAAAGGGLGALGGVLIQNSTFSGNTAQSGGGAYIRTPLSSGRSSFEFITITDNTAPEGGGIYREFAGVSTFAISRSIVAGNAPANCAHTMPGTRSTSGGFNLDDDNTCGFTAATDLANTVPQLGPLRDNGGPTRTHALPMFSAAVDRAGHSSIRVDQRGAPRPHGVASDIGAFEFAMPRLTGYHFPDRLLRLHGFVVRLEIRGTSGSTIGEIVPAIGNMPLSVEIDKSGTAVTVSAFNLDIDVEALRKQTGQKQPVLFYVGADAKRNGSELLLIANPRFDAVLKDVDTLPISRK